MVWGQGSDTLVVQTRWDILGISLGGAPMWLCGVGVGFTERSVGRRIQVTYEALSADTITYMVLPKNKWITINYKYSKIQQEAMRSLGELIPTLIWT